MVGVRSATVAALLAPLLLAACSMGDDEPATAAETAPATTAEEPLEVPPPERLRVQAGTFRATLSWQPSTSGPPLDGYDIYRNDRLVGSVSGHATQYADGAVLPRTRYRWEVVARAGEVESEPVSARARTKAPPLTEARLEGDFTIRLTVSSHSGYERIGEPANLGWRFAPRCRDGTCRRVALRDLQRREFRAVLTRDGRTYTGSYTGWFFATCSGTRSTSTVTFELVVKRARTIGRAWHATRLTGTVTSSEAPQLGCIAGTATVEVRGRLHTSSLEAR